MNIMIDAAGDVPGDSTTRGQWEPGCPLCAHLPVHVALLHTGKVLTFGGSCNDPTLEGHPRPAELWDPETGGFEVVGQDLGGDIFCAGHVCLPDGRLLVAGGTSAYDTQHNLFGQTVPLPPFRGSDQTYIFDPTNQRWTRGSNMASGRWYPTLVMLGDGRVLAVAGLTHHFPWVVQRQIEIFSPGEGWQVLKGAERWMPLYPRLHLLPDGRVFYSGSYNTHYTFPFSLQQFPTSILDLNTNKWDGLGLPNKSEREEGTTVLLPLTPPEYRARVLLAGGGTTQGTDAIADCEIIDLSGDAMPRWRLIDSMHHPRYYVYPVMLPDGQLLALGGRSGAKGHSMTMPDGKMPQQPMSGIGSMPDEQMGMPPGGVPHDVRAVLEPELFDPVMEHWTQMAPMKVDRLYHSGAVLLPDGRVATFGNNPMRGVDELRIEIYHPPYLFRGPRPNLHSAPSDVGYGQEFMLDSPEAEAIDKVVLIRPTTTTHCVNTEQRLVELEFDRGGPAKLVARVPQNTNVLPPGYYMLFILSQGVPSISKMLLVHHSSPRV